MLEKSTGPLYATAATTGSRLLKLAGVPGRYWQINRKVLPSPASLIVKRPWYQEGKAFEATARQQQEWLDDLLVGDAMKSSESPFVVVSGYPTDDMALVFGALAVMKASTLGLRVNMISAHKSIRDIRQEDNWSSLPDVLLIYNLVSDTNRFRLDIVREWIAEADDSLVILLVGGCDPVTFCFDTLKKPFDRVLYFQGQYRGEASQRRV